MSNRVYVARSFEDAGIERISRSTIALYSDGRKNMLSLLWGLVVLLVALWALGLALHIAGGLIHALLLIAIGLAVYNFFKARDV